ncbi:MAG: hypothetical protein WC005_04915 [Candidatus Nanopelagicales bacterium]
MTNAQARGPLAPILISVAWVIIALLAFFPTITTFMLFDAGADNVDVWVWFVFYGMWAFFLLSLLEIPGIWITWAIARDRKRGNVALLVVALVPVLALIPVAIGVVLDW